jgi:ABC-type glutathione transport system ATPase component
VTQAPPAATALDGREPSGSKPLVGAASRVTIRCRDVHKFYLAGERSVYALKGITVDVREREFVSIVGKSGCGKSTLLHCIAGLLPVSHGDISINGEPVLKPCSRRAPCSGGGPRWRTSSCRPRCSVCRARRRRRARGSC